MVRLMARSFQIQFVQKRNHSRDSGYKFAQTSNITIEKNTVILSVTKDLIA